MAGTNLAELDGERRRKLLARCGGVLFAGARADVPDCRPW